MTEERAREIMSQVRLCQGANPNMGRIEAAIACGIAEQEYREACSYWGRRNGCSKKNGDSQPIQVVQDEQLGYTMWLVNNVTLDEWAKTHGAKITRQDTPTTHRYTVEWPKSEAEVLQSKIEAMKVELRKLTRQAAALQTA